jgi:hypothetical protein
MTLGEKLSKVLALISPVKLLGNIFDGIAAPNVSGFNKGVQDFGKSVEKCESCQRKEMTFEKETDEDEDE